MDKKKVSSREVLKVVLNVLLAILALAALFAAFCGVVYLFSLWYEASCIDYKTTDVAQYGKFEFLSDEDYQAYILPVFPKSIQPEFEDVIYDYHASRTWSHGYTAYLEFTIRDPEKFDAFVQSTTQGLAKGAFHFDNAYEEYVLFDEDTGWVFDSILLLDPPKPEDIGQYYTVHSARIVKVLVDRSQHRMIYIYIHVSEQELTTEDLNIYFSRFQIDPKEYEAYTETIVPIPVPTTEEPEKTFEERVAHVLEKLKSGDFFKEIADNIWGDWEDTRYDYLNR